LPLQRSTRVGVTFVNHHDFRSNSGVHIFNLANELAALGLSSAVLVPRKPRSAHLLGRPRFAAHRYVGAHRARSRLLHAWTPRRRVRKTTTKLAGKWLVPYVVHLEDNEDLVGAERAGASAEELLELDPAELRQLVSEGHLPHRDFIAGARGVTAVIDTLLEFVPGGVPTAVIDPAFEEDLFRPQPPDRGLRAELGLTGEDRIVVYSGNAHPLNAGDIENLYRAVKLVNDAGTSLKLIRLGDDHVVDLSSAERALGQALIRIPYVERREVPRYLALADVLVQPGRPSSFDSYRIPAKLPEFLAMGKPVVLPRTNLGSSLKDGESCLLLETGEPGEIAARIRESLGDPELGRRLGEGARRFALERFSWARSAAVLKSFYERVLSGE
jgi:glycosyltransferase involved in cell wall biosynthesis